MSLWGTEECPKWLYLNTTLGLRFIRAKVRSKKRIGPHNIDIISLIFGSMLGDSFGEKHGNGTRFVLQQEQSNMSYLMWYHKYLADRGYCNIDKPKLLTKIGKEGKIRYNYKIRTWTFNS